MLKKLALSILVIGVATLSSLPCSIPTVPPEQFDLSQYIFVGRITGYAETKLVGDPEATEGLSAGVLIEPTLSFYTPMNVKGKYEVYVVGVKGDCSRYPIPLASVKERFRIGDQVRVIAGMSEYISDSSDPMTNRLEVRKGKVESITILKENDPILQDLSTIFDYKAYRIDLIGDPYFELLKDLRRLNQSNENEKKEILDRLTFFPAEPIFLEELYKQNTPSRKEFDRFSKLLRERAMTPGEIIAFRERLTMKNEKKVLKP